MRILQVYPLSMKVRGNSGVSEHVWNISERLARKHDVTLFGLNPHNRYSRFDIVDGVSVERFRHFYPSSSYFFSLELPLRLRQVEFDVVHAHSYHSFPMHVAALAKCKKFVVTTHYHGESASVFRDSLFRLFQPLGGRTLRKADAVVAVSEYEKKLLCNRFRFVKDKLVVIPNGLDLQGFANLDRKNRDFKSILFVGRLDQYKGVQYLVEVLPKLAENVILEIVGNGVMRKKLEDRAMALGVGRRVIFYQNLSRKELLQKYADADVFVLLSLYEAYSLVVAEALAAGTPCILANTSALSEWIDEENCFGIRFPFRLDELAELIVKVLGARFSKDLVHSYIANKKILDWNTVAKSIEDVYSY